MATTTNYGWTTPDDTALVKDGASAIRALGTAIDTSMNTALGTKKSGLVLLNTTSFSGVTSQSFNNVFSSTYTNYRIIYNNTTAASNVAVTLRYRASASDTSTNYVSQRFYSTSTTNVGAANPQGTDEIYLMDIDSGSNQTRSAFDMVIYSPNVAQPTNMTLQATYVATSTPYLMLSTGVQTDSTQFDGFTLLAANNFGGTISIYGFNK